MIINLFLRSRYSSLLCPWNFPSNDLIFNADYFLVILSSQLAMLISSFLLKLMEPYIRWVLFFPSALCPECPRTFSSSICCFISNNFSFCKAWKLCYCGMQTDIPVWSGGISLSGLQYLTLCPFKNIFKQEMMWGWGFKHCWAQKKLMNTAFLILSKTNRTWVGSSVCW